MEYGMPFLMETNTLEECARLCSHLGLDFIELNICLSGMKRSFGNILRNLERCAGAHEVKTVRAAG